VPDLIVTFLGPRQLWGLARVDIDDRLTGANVKSLVAEIERALTRDSRFVARVDVVPSSGDDQSKPR